jgi:hypothetical protein
MTDLDILLGSWVITGRTLKSDQDDISGDLVVTPLLGGRMLQLAGGMSFGGTRTDSVELIWAEDDKPGYAAHVYSGTGAPLDYRWSRDGDTLIHAGFGMTYTGTISADGATIEGDWEPDPDRPDMAEAAYHATMRRSA